MKFRSFVSPVTVLATSLLFVSFSSVSFAANSENSQIGKSELRGLLKTAKTPDEHRRIAAFYQQEAQRLTADAKSHEEMERTYRNTPLLFQAKHPYGALGVSHCKYWAQLDLQQAQETQALAKLHQDMANAAEQK